MDIQQSVLTGNYSHYTLKVVSHVPGWVTDHGHSGCDYTSINNPQSDEGLFRITAQF